MENHLLVPLNECAIHTKSHEFQYKVMNRILPFSDFLFQNWNVWVDSSLYVLSLNVSLSVSHLYKISGIQFNCFLEVISYIVSEVDVFLGISKPVKDSLLYNHLIFLSKQHIYSCKLKNTYTTGVVFLAKVKAVF